jgi:hypothetical protein
VVPRSGTAAEDCAIIGCNPAAAGSTYGKSRVDLQGLLQKIGGCEREVCKLHANRAKSLQVH